MDAEAQTHSTRVNRKLLKAQLQQILRELRLPQLYIFGSVARGDDTSSSDVDILIDLTGTSFYTDEVKTIIENRIGRRTDVINMESFLNPVNISNAPNFTRNILRDKKVIYA